MAEANPSPQGGPASEEIAMLAEKQEVPKELKAKEETKFNLWGFFLLHLSR
mgnify:CR=1 FL=1